MKLQPIHIDSDLLAKEISFRMSASSGNGGQNVNRLATKATLFYSIEDSALFSPQQKQHIQEKLSNRINKEGQLIVVNQTTRSALQNQKAAIRTLIQLLKTALTVEKPRKKFRKIKALDDKRLAEKKQNAEKKALRRVDLRNNEME